jgi:drug/metabolite transporter (DMT)-like permease
MTAAERQHRYRVMLAFALVYVFWGSTYLGIRLAIEHVPPVLMAGTRFVVAGLIMLAGSALAGRRIAVGAPELLRLGIVGVLLLSIANCVLAWAELYVPTGLAALIIAVTPLWFLVLDALLLGEHRVTARGAIGLVLGVVGVVVLIWPKLSATGPLGRMQLLASLSLLGSSLSWATGSVLSKRWQAGVDPFTGTGWQMLIAGVVNVLLGLGLGQHHRAHWTAAGVGAIAYLVVFGSLVGFTAYIWLLEHVPTSKVATYAYVNPVVAVFLGWLILNERIDAYILAGTAIIIPAVALVTSAKLKRKIGAPAREPELPAVEAGAD